MKQLLSVLFLLVSVSIAQPPAITIRGIVTDATTGEPLPNASLRLLGTSKGTVTNAAGEFLFPLSSTPVRLAVSYIGYRSDTVVISSEEKNHIHIALTPNAVQLSGVTITDEDPAYEIIRRAVESKKKWMPKLRTFEAKAFNRTQMRTDSSIAFITEAYSTLYWKQNDSIREVIRQQKQTGNLPKGMMPSRVGSIMNFNDDEIKQGGFIFTGPTAPNAFQYYDYKLLASRKMDDFEVYDIQLIPRTELVPLFQGKISIAERSYAVMEVELQPNSAFVQPFVKLISPRYTQRFRLVDEKFWLPANYRYEAVMEISIAGIQFPKIGVERDVVMYDYTVNPVFADSIFSMKSFTIDSSANSIDSLFWSENNVLPLTAEQESAYATLDSTQSLEKKLQPSGVTYQIVNALFSEGVSGWADLYYNRVEGFHLGVAKNFYDSAAAMKYNLTAGYGVSDKEMKYGAGIAWRFGKNLNSTVGITGGNLLFTKYEFELGVSLYKKFDGEPQSMEQNRLINTFDALFQRKDYYNYYRVIGGNISATWNLSALTHAAVVILSEEQSSLKKHTDFSFVTKSSFLKIPAAFYNNPGIYDGRLRSVNLEFDYRSSKGLSLARQALFVNTRMEYSSSAISSDFNYMQAEFRLLGKITTMAQSLFSPPALTVVLSGGTTFGSVPPQRYFTLTPNSSSLSQTEMLRGMFPHEFYGDRFALLYVEHNFRRMPFVWWSRLYKTNLEFIVNGAVARGWRTSHSLLTPKFPFRDTNGLYAEAGFGISNLLDVFRVDLTYRLTAPRMITASLLVSDFIMGFFE
ncbi:MAG: carboxypeptidase-like regulatory domain-containing protein [Bacteroidetes bacterium]|nr:carboxypeptidase-like regulatory domain-containing protein [Bacteroidota bacterium]